jgi:four helix bundle protein
MVKIECCRERKPAYEQLKFYQDICDIRRTVYKITEKFAKVHLRLVSQMKDAARSAKQNVREGYKKGTVGEFIHSINISRASLEELKGDIEDCYEDNLIAQEEFKNLSDLIRSADYLSLRYIQSLYKMQKNNSWKVPGQLLKGNICNI